MIAFTCSGCGKSITVPDECIGQPATCPSCKHSAVVSDPADGATQAVGPRPAQGATLHLTPQAPAAPPADTPRRATMQATASNTQLDFLAPARSADEIGRLGSYSVLKLIGSGGMGVVLHAEDRKLNRAVALKVMRPEVAADPLNRQRFMREAQATAAVEHPNVIHIYQIDEDRGIPFLTMPLLRGESLETRLRRESSFPVSDAVRIARQVAEGLAAAHERGLTHRDIKPANLWLEDKTGFVKILDFGLARAVAESVHLTKIGEVMGTPAYMSPEQAAGHNVDARSDLFSLGAVLYRMLTGEFPFKGTTTIALLTALATETPTPPSTLNPRIPTRLSDLVLRLLARDPADRPKSAAAVARALAAAADGAPDSRANENDTGRLDAHRARPRKRPRLLALAGAALLLLFLMGISLAAWLHNRDTRTPPSSETTGTPSAPPLAIAPFHTLQARAHQEAWAQYLDVPVEHTNAIGMRFRLIPPGEFTLGMMPDEVEAYAKLGPRTNGGKEASPAHPVRLTRAFYLGEREVDVAQFREVMKREPNHPDVPKGSRLEGPLTQYCTWAECIEFCNRLSERDGLPPAYARAGATVRLVPDAAGYRLPTEAEWEFACRAGTTTLWYHGMSAAEAARDLPAAMGRHQARLDLPNPFGLFNLYASSAEWCADFYQPSYYAECAARGLSIDPMGPAASPVHIQRGGSHFSDGGRDLSSINSAVRGTVNEADAQWSGFGRIVLPIRKGR